MGRIGNGKTERERQREGENQNGCKMNNIYVRIIENKNGLQATEQEETINRKEERKKKKKRNNFKNRKGNANSWKFT